MRVLHFMRVATGIMLAGAATAGDQANQISEPTSSLASGSATSGVFQFSPFAGSTACTDGGSSAEPFAVPAGFAWEREMERLDRSYREVCRVAVTPVAA